MNEEGYTLDELLESGRKLATQLKAGKYPEGTDPRDWRIYGDMAVYCPYIPLQYSPSLEKSKDDYYDTEELQRCQICDQVAWDGCICHSCGAKDFGI